MSKNQIPYEGFEQLEKLKQFSMSLSNDELLIFSQSIEQLNKQLIYNFYQFKLYGNIQNCLYKTFNDNLSILENLIKQYRQNIIIIEKNIKTIKEHDFFLGLNYSIFSEEKINQQLLNYNFVIKNQIEMIEITNNLICNYFKLQNSDSYQNTNSYKCWHKILLSLERISINELEKKLIQAETRLRKYLNYPEQSGQLFNVKQQLLDKSNIIYPNQNDLKIQLSELLYNRYFTSYQQIKSIKQKQKIYNRNQGDFKNYSILEQNFSWLIHVQNKIIDKIDYKQYNALYDSILVEINNLMNLLDSQNIELNKVLNTINLINKKCTYISNEIKEISFQQFITFDLKQLKQQMINFIEADLVLLNEKIAIYISKYFDILINKLYELNQNATQFLKTKNNNYELQQQQIQITLLEKDTIKYNEEITQFFELYNQIKIQDQIARETHFAIIKEEEQKSLLIIQQVNIQIEQQFCFINERKIIANKAEQLKKCFNNNELFEFDITEQELKSEILYQIEIQSSLKKQLIEEKNNFEQNQNTIANIFSELNKDQIQLNSMKNAERISILEINSLKNETDSIITNLVTQSFIFPMIPSEPMRKLLYILMLLLNNKQTWDTVLDVVSSKYDDFQDKLKSVIYKNMDQLKLKTINEKLLDKDISLDNLRQENIFCFQIGVWLQQFLQIEQKYRNYCKPLTIQRQQIQIKLKNNELKLKNVQSQNLSIQNIIQNIESDLTELQETLSTYNFIQQMKHQKQCQI